jgi:glutathione synthase/RimK-type ligase-like ATP-grasp enzyme
MALLLAGGCEDFNLTVLADAAQRNQIEIVDARVPAGESPAFCWNPGDAAPSFGGKRIRASGAFLRQDVFGGMKDPRPEVQSRALAWYQTLMGWLLSEPGIRVFNRHSMPSANNKPAALALAREAGLRIPATWITNDTAKLDGRPAETMIAKPVLGGDFCYSLPDALDMTGLRNGLAAMPAIVQERLVAPEVRIYVIGESAFAFEVRSSSLDYRVNQDAELVFLPNVPPELLPLRKLMSRLGLDFGAADFKTDPDTGQLVFLELNTSPMFARFDRESDGRLVAAILQELTGC